MGVILKEEASGYELPPSGTFQAVCYSIIDLGTQVTSFEGEKKLQKQVVLSWELSEGEDSSREKPFTISKTYTQSLGTKSKLRQHLDSWRGKAFTEEELSHFDLSKILGKSCFINIGHKTSQTSQKTYAEVAAVLALPKGCTAQYPTNPILDFAFSEFSFDTFDKVPEWLQNKIKESPEYQTYSLTAKPPEGHLDDLPPMEEDIPF